MVLSWAIKELMTALKMNFTTLRRMTRAQMVAQINAVRLAGDMYHNDDDLSSEIYRSGDDSAWKLSKFSNLLFRSELAIGIGSTKKEVFDEIIVNAEGLCNTRIMIGVQWKSFVSLAGDIDVEIDDQTTQVSDTIALSSDPTPNWEEKIFSLNTSAYPIDATFNISLDIRNVNIRDVTFRGY